MNYMSLPSLSFEGGTSKCNGLKLVIFKCNVSYFTFWIVLCLYKRSNYGILFFYKCITLISINLVECVAQSFHKLKFYYFSLPWEISSHVPWLTCILTMIPCPISSLNCIKKINMCTTWSSCMLDFKIVLACHEPFALGNSFLQDFHYYWIKKYSYNQNLGHEK
jgi:hypothetical protein